jgi:hypothetical protein
MLIYEPNEPNTMCNGFLRSSKYRRRSCCEISTGYRRRKLLLNVQSRFDLNPIDLLNGRSPRLQYIADELEECIEVSRAFKISYSSEVVSSVRPLSSVINGRARNFDLVVMGSNGAEDLYELLGGSNTYKTIVNSQTPLLMVPVDYIYSAPAESSTHSTTSRKEHSP